MHSTFVEHLHENTKLVNIILNNFVYNQYI